MAALHTRPHHKRIRSPQERGYPRIEGSGYKVKKLFELLREAVPDARFGFATGLAVAPVVGALFFGFGATVHSLTCFDVECFKLP
jgi:hypothetical protein